VDGNTRFGALSAYYFIDDYTLTVRFHRTSVPMCLDSEPLRSVDPS